MLSRCRSLSYHLNSVLPDAGLAELIVTRGQAPFEILRKPAKVLSSNVPATGPTSTSTHPVVFARRLMQLALCLQQVEVDPCQRQHLQFEEPLLGIARRYIEAARHVTSQDLLVNSVEGIELLMLEARYMINLGDLHNAWLIFRRALGLSQLLSNLGSHLEYLWTRLMCAERGLTLIMGGDLTDADHGLLSEVDADSTEEKLDRIHAKISGRIIKRNVHMQRRRCWGQREDDEYNGPKEMQDIDYELKQASRSALVSWWAIPSSLSLATKTNPSENFAKLRTQMDHNHLLLLLHQPYLIANLCSPPVVHNLPTLDQLGDSYSTLAAVSAAREVLIRFPLFRRFPHVPLSYRALEHKAFTAATTLLLAHLAGHRLDCANVLEHQRPQDLAAIQEAVSFIEELFCSINDDSASSNACVLNGLLKAEADAGEGIEYIVLHENSPKPDAFETCKDEYKVELSMPYIGTLKVIRQDQRCTEDNRQDPQFTESANDRVDCFEPEPVVSNLQNIESDFCSSDQWQFWDFDIHEPSAFTAPLQRDFITEDRARELPTLPLYTQASDVYPPEETSTNGNVR